MTGEAGADIVDFWFDPLCPFTWITSRWIVEVQQVRRVSVRWHPMSLYHLNHERRGLPEAYRAKMTRALSVGRVLMAARGSLGPETLGPLYTALGDRIHPRRQDPGRALVVSALRDAGLPEDLDQAFDDRSHDEPLRRSLREAQDLLGDDVGSPTLAFNGAAFVGPVLTRIPRGEEAGRLWDGTVMVAGFPYFCEIKRSRTGVLEFG